MLLRSVSLRLLKFWKQFRTNRHITKSRGKTFGRRNTQPYLIFSVFEKWQTISNQSVTQCFVLVFYAQYLRFRLKDIISCHPWEFFEIDVLLYGHYYWGESCLTQISILKRYNNFRCALRQRWKLFAQSAPKFWKSHSCKIWLWNKALFIWHNNTENQSLHLYKSISNNNPGPQWNLHVHLGVSKPFSSILEGPYSPVHVNGKHKG